MDGFILGTEESHGYLMGNYARDKDAAGAAVWLAEYAAELKRSGRTLVDELDRIYADYGYCHNYLTEIRLLGATGMDQIQHIMDHLRQHMVETFGEFGVQSKRDRWEGDPQPHLSRTDTFLAQCAHFPIGKANLKRKACESLCGLRAPNPKSKCISR